jgi:tetratricopeptide (TPR) repeat protein
VNAILSAERGVGLLIHEDELVGWVTPQAHIEKSAPLPFVAAWLREAESPFFLDDTDVESAQRKLSILVDGDRAFRLFLPLFDLSISAEIRDSVGAEIERLFQSRALLQYRTAARFYGQPFPTLDNLDAALNLAADRPWPLLHRLLSRLVEDQPTIRAVCFAWAELPPDKFIYTHAASWIREIFVRLGIFYRLVDTIASGASLAGFIDVEGASRHIAHIPHRWFILRQWLDPLFREQALERQQAAYNVKLAQTRAGIDERKALILEFVKRGDIPAAEAAAKELVEFQRERGPAKYAAMSLCDLAMQAKDRGSYSAQEIFARLATQTEADDPQCWTQLADARKMRGHAGEALDMYDRIIEVHPENVVARNGRAEVLRDLNRLTDALAAYEATIEAHPEDRFAKNGRAEVLRDLNRLTDALAAYEAAIEAHPENVVAKTGRAEVLRDLNRPDDALAAYEATIEAHPEDVVAKSGRAEVLRDLNRLTDALAAYEATIEAHPENVVAKSGRAEVLRDLNRLNDALVAYEATIEAHPGNVMAKAGRAEVLRDLNRLNDALVAYEATIEAHPEDVVPKNGRAEVLRDLNRLNDALAAYEVTIEAHPENVVAKNGRANILCKLERDQEALEHLPVEPIVALSDWIGFHMRGMIYLRQRRWTEAQRIFRLGCEAGLPPHHTGYFRTALALAQIRLGNLSDALQNLDAGRSRRLRRVRPAFRAHALGATGAISECKFELVEARKVGLDAVKPVVDEVEARFVAQNPRYDLDWLLDAEIDLLLAA